MVPAEFSLSQNYPNPFNPSTTIKFSVPKLTEVKLTVYDALGKEVTTLVNNSLEAGNYNIEWNASNNASGIYFYKLETNEYVNVKKMILVK